MTRIILTSGTTWIVPADWNNAANTIECVGGGAGSSAGTTTTAGGGGGGGAYAAISNFSTTPGTSITIAVATSVGASANGKNTYFNGASLGASSVGAAGGSTATTISTGGIGGLVASSVGTTLFAGGNGGSTTNAGALAGGGGGAGAGPTAGGGNGGSTAAAGTAGSGGGGGDGGSAGGAGTGSAGSGGAGANGGGNGGNGGTTGGSVGSQGTEWTTRGAAGGGGGAGYNASGTGYNGGAGNTGGSGAGGGGVGSTAGGNGQNGGAGLIVITYTPLDVPPYQHADGVHVLPSVLPRRSVELLTFAPPVNLSLYPPVAAATIPYFPNYDQPNPTRSPPARGDQITWLQSPAVVPASLSPFTESDWPNPQTPRRSVDLLTWGPPLNQLLLAPPVPTVDGSATGVAGAATTLSITLTTTNANDIIIIQSVAEQNSTTVAPHITSITGGGLTFARRTSQLYVPGSAYPAFYQEVWWAAAPAALTSTTFTVHYSATVDNAAATAFGVSGCNTASPWDTNVSLPNVTEVIIGGSNAPITTGSVSTTSTNDLLLYFGATANGALSPQPASFTLIKTQYYDGQNVQVDCTSAYLSLAGTITAQTYITGNFQAGQPGTVLIDALAPGITSGSITIPYAPNYDQPNPSRLAPVRGDQISWLQSPAVPVPILIPFHPNYDQPNPTRLPIQRNDLLTWTRSAYGLLYPPSVFTIPYFPNYDQPNPIRLPPVRGEQITWLQSPAVPSVVNVLIPYTPNYDQPNPTRLPPWRPDDLTWLQSPAVAVHVLIPYTPNYDQPNPTRLAPHRPDDLTWLQPHRLLKPVPFMGFIQPNPTRLPPHRPDDLTWLRGPLPPQTVLIPYFPNYDQPNPRVMGRTIALRIFTVEGSKILRVAGFQAIGQMGARTP